MRPFPLRFAVPFALVVACSTGAGSGSGPERDAGVFADATTVDGASSPADSGVFEDAAQDAAVADAADAAPIACPDGSLRERNSGVCLPMIRGTCTLPAIPSTTDISTTNDVVYSTPFRGTANAQPQALDIAWPRVGTGHPFVVVVHGGGFGGGDKSEHRDDIKRLAGQGYVAASINYRLVTNGANRFPAAPSDTRCALRWAKSHAQTYGADPNRVLAVGASAGANLVALLGTSADDSALDDGTCEQSMPAPSVAGVVSYYGRMDLSRAPIPDYIVDYIGREGDWLGRESLGSPIRHIASTDPPFLLIHGQNDGTVPIEQSRLFRDALRAAKVPVALLELPNQGHGFPLFSSDAGLGSAGCSTLNFLGTFAPEVPQTTPQRTVVFVQKETTPGEQVFLRGGHASSLVNQGVYVRGSESIRYLNGKNPATDLAKRVDGSLDWFSDSPLDWTCDHWPSSYGPLMSYATNGYGEDPENHWGLHAWKFDVTMDGTAGEWFEFKAFVRTPGATPAERWEPDVHPANAPHDTGNHWAKKGAVTFVRFGEAAAESAP